MVTSYHSTRYINLNCAINYYVKHIERGTMYEFDFATGVLEK
jgi:hypothetical protein